MAARKDSERLNQALQTLQEVRGELSFEAAWLRDRLSPAKVAHRTLDNHTLLVMGTVFGGGLLAATALLRKGRHPVVEAPRSRHAPPPSVAAPVAKASIISTLFTAAVPLVLKFATSKPVVTRLLDVAMHARRRPANRNAPVA